MEKRINNKIEKTVIYLEDYPDMLGILKFSEGKTNKEVLTDFFALCWFICGAYGDIECITGNAERKVKITIKKVRK